MKTPNLIGLILASPILGVLDLQAFLNWFLERLKEFLITTLVIILPWMPVIGLGMSIYLYLHGGGDVK